MSLLVSATRGVNPSYFIRLVLIFCNRRTLQLTELSPFMEREGGGGLRERRE